MTSIIIKVFFGCLATLLSAMAVIGSAHHWKSTGSGMFAVVLCSVGFFLVADFLIKMVIKELKRGTC